MLVLFETPGGQALFKVADEGKLKDVDSIHKHFESPEGANKLLKLKAFNAFEDTTEAVAAATSMMEGSMDKKLKKFLKKNLKGDLNDKLAVCDKAVGNIVKEKIGIKCVHDNAVMELMRGIRSQMTSLIAGLGEGEVKAMTLGLAHSLSRYKLKFSADKVDTMVIQAIGLLDELDKEINTYSMRVREWFGWHFPEMGKVVQDNLQYAKTVKKMKLRTNAQTMDFSDILDEDVEGQLKEVAEISMGTEIAEDDVENITALCDQVISLSEYRTQLFDYLKNRMNAIAPNLTVMVGELVGARLISHAGSLMNLAKHPASTVQILGAEKALFRALKTKHETPKYGLIYHASLIGQTAPKNKGKISRVLAAKTALAIRVDALGDTSEATIGYDNRAKVEARMRQLEGGNVISLNKGKGKEADQLKKASPSSTPSKAYNAASDIAMGDATPKKGKKRAAEEMDSDKDESEDEDSEKDKKKLKKEAKKAKKEAKKAKKEKSESEDEKETPKKKAKKDKKKKKKSA